MPSSVEVSPERCASGEKRTSPSATPQQTAYTSGGETGRGEKPATRGRRKGEEPKLRIDDRGKKKKKKRAPSHRGPHCPALSQALSRSERGATTSRGPARSFARKPGAAERESRRGQPRTCARGGGGGRRRPRPLEAAGRGPPRGRQRGAAARGEATPFYSTWSDCLLSSFAVPRGDRSGPWASPVAPRWSLRPPRRPHPAPTGLAPAAATSRRRGGTRGRTPLPGPGNGSVPTCFGPAAPELSVTQSLPDPWVSATAGSLRDSFPLTPREERGGTSPTCNQVK